MREMRDKGEKCVLIIGFVAASVIIVALTMVLHFFLNDYLKNFEKGVQKKKEYWLKIINRSTENKNYHMSWREIKKLTSPQFLKAFYSLLTENGKDACQLLEQK